MSDYDELDRFMSRYLEGGIDVAELAELEAKLLTDDQFAEHLSRWCLMHRQITDLLSEQKLHQLMDRFVQGSPTLPKKAFAQLVDSTAIGSHKSTGGSASRTIPIIGRYRWRNPRFLVPTVSFLVVTAVIVGFAVWSAGHRGAVPPDHGSFAKSNENAGEESSEIIATLTQISDGVWEPHVSPLSHGQQLTKDSRIALRSGLAKVTFECGAEVVLQGPCDFVIQSRMVGFLKSGKIMANVPRRAFSFAILSPEVDFVDLGTSFGVSVGSNGRTELHVFEGEVLCSSAKSETKERPEVIHVTAEKAVEFNSPGGAPSNIAMDKEQFAHLIALRRPTTLQPNRLIPDRLALWLAADLAVATDAKQRVITWQDILYGDNQLAEDATQNDERARPTLVRNAVHGQPAVRFNGQSDFLLTTPLETTDDQTVLLVCQFSPSAYDKSRVWGGQIINYDGPPSREAYGYLSDTLQPGVLQIGEPLLAEEFKPTLLTAQVFAGFVGSATVESGRVDAEQVGADTPVVVSYVYDYGKSRAVLSINGRSYGEARVFAPQGITSRKIIGRHAWKQLFFHGDLAELLIYNKALSPAEIASTTAYLAEKYAIQLDSGARVEQDKR